MPLTFLAIAAICSFTSSQGDPDEELRRLIANVEANEALYRNLDVELDYEYRNVSPNPLKGDGPTAFAKGPEHSVTQGPLLRYIRTGTKRATSGKAWSMDVDAAFDGERSTFVEQSALVNIHRGRKEHRGLVKPHLLLMQRAGGVDFPLSVFLAKDRISRVRPYDTMNVDITYLGEETVAGLRCSKVRFVQWGKAGDRKMLNSERFLWIAPERNCMIIKSVGNITTGGKQLSLVNEGRITEFREIEPGIWFPFEAEAVVYDANLLRRSGERARSNITTWHVKRVDLHPNYDKSFFSVKIPDNSFVYEIENGKIVKSYRNEARLAVRRRGVFPWTWVLLAAALVALGSAWPAIRLWKRRSALLASA